MALGLCAVTALSGSAAGPLLQRAPIFRFHTDESWLNLHQFLYVLGRHEAGMADRTRRAVATAPAESEKGLTALSADEQKLWRDAVRSYGNGLSKQDAVFDKPLIDLAHTLVRVGGASALSGPNPNPEVSRMLVRVAPIYRRVWWPEHERANHAWATSANALLDKHGRAVLDRITRAYGMSWPGEGYPVHLSGYANWAGAFSTRGNLLIVSSLDSGNRGLVSLEVVFHEAMHQWDDDVEPILTRLANERQLRVRDWLSHALIFYTAGEAVRSVSSEHVPYAEANGIWQQPARQIFKPVFDEVWKPYLLGKGGNRDEVLAEILKRTSNLESGLPTALRRSLFQQLQWNRRHAAQPPAIDRH